MVMLAVSAFALNAPALLAQSFSPIPILPHDHLHKSRGKAPGTSRLLPKWDDWCKKQASQNKIAEWSGYPNCGVGVACGYAGLIAVDIDDEALVDPLRCVLPLMLVAKRGRKGLTAFYRVTEPLPSKNYRTPSPDKRGLLDFLSEGKQTVLPPSVHPDTGEPYVWLTPNTLINTSLAQLPEFTSDHYDKMEEVLRAHGWAAPVPLHAQKDAVERSSHSIGVTLRDDDFSRAFIAGRAAYLPRLGLTKLTPVAGGWRAIPTFRPSSTGRAEHKRGLSLSIRNDGPIVDHGTGDGFNDVTLVARCSFNDDTGQAFAWLCETLNIEVGPQIAIKPTHKDNRVSLPDAVARLEHVLARFDHSIHDGIAIRNRERLTQSLIQPTHPIVRVRSEAGVSKSTIAIRHSAAQAKRGRRMIYAIPEHGLANQVLVDFASHGIKAKIYRGYEQPDPTDPNHAMCRNKKAYEAARDLGVSIRSEICEREVDGESAQCPFIKDCGMERQRQLRSQVWIVPHALLFIKRPDFIPEPDGVVIDESFINNAISKPIEVSMGLLLRFEVEDCSNEETDIVGLWRARLAAAVNANGDGPLSRDALATQEITAEIASDVSLLEARRLFRNRLRPDMLGSEFSAAAVTHKGGNTMARNAATLWQELATFLDEGNHEDFYGPRALSGRLSVANGNIHVAPLRPVHQDWRDCPVLILDATAPPANALAKVFGEIDIPGLPPVVTSEPDVAAKWSSHVHVRQILHAPVSMGKLGLTGASKPDNEKAILRYIRRRALPAAPAPIGLITYKGFIEKHAKELPLNIVTLHFGRLAGMNTMKDVTGLIVIGRQRPPKAVIETEASVLAGYPIATDGPHYSRATASIQLENDSLVGVPAEFHQDQFAEAVRWRKTEGELEQAIGRIRAHRRNAPCWLDIVNDVSLPVKPRDVMTWDNVEKAGEAPGLTMANRRHAVVVLGLSERDAKAVAKIVSLGTDSTMYKVESVPNEITYNVTYRYEGHKEKTAKANLHPYVFKGGYRALRKLLEKNGPLAKLDIQGRKLKDSPEATARLACTALAVLANLEASGRLDLADMG
ncbi:MAG: bifunctional DNA primase/polymerase [Alcaligenaceae bacterium]|nr:MAG: bifunctional DNA primase/polymerase [Alcaligenaceae bacterium]